MPQVSPLVTQNYRRSFASSNFGTRKLAFYQFMIDPSAGLVGNVTNGIAFRVNTSTGAVTNDATITARATVDMYDLNTGEDDDGVYNITLPWTINVLGYTGTTVSVDTNSILYFANVDSSNYSRQGPSDPTFDGNNVPGVAIANNDGDLQYLFVEETGTTGSRQYRIKFQGNTDYSNDTFINLVWEVVFYENTPGYIDFLITQQPTDWNAYDDGEGNVAWGVSDGTNWVDSFVNHDQQNTFGEFATIGQINWSQSDSLYHQIVRTLQQANVEFFWLGQPHNAQEIFTQNWDPIIPLDLDGFVFAIADDAGSPQAHLSDTTVVEATDTNDYNPGYITITNPPFGNGVNIEIGMKVTFSGNVFGGLVADKPYYIVDAQYTGVDDKWAISVSETADPNVQDITYPDGIGGVPGEPVTLTTATGHMDVTFNYYNVVWQGTAGDFQSECCGNIDMPGIVPTNFFNYIGNSGILPNTIWWLQRLNPTFGLFPGCWAQAL